MGNVEDCLEGFALRRRTSRTNSMRRQDCDRRAIRRSCGRPEALLAQRRSDSSWLRWKIVSLSKFAIRGFPWNSKPCVDLVDRLLQGGNCITVLGPIRQCGAQKIIWR